MKPITWDDFTKVELRLGSILTAEPFPEAPGSPLPGIYYAFCCRFLSCLSLRVIPRKTGRQSR